MHGRRAGRAVVRIVRQLWSKEFTAATAGGDRVIASATVQGSVLRAWSTRVTRALKALFAWRFTESEAEYQVLGCVVAQSSAVVRSSKLEGCPTKFFPGSMSSRHSTFGP